VSTNHEITDGLGLLALAHAPLALSIADLPYEALDRTPRLEDTISLQPGILHLLSVAWAAYVVPLLPALLRPVRPWPGTTIAKPPMECPHTISLLALPTTLVLTLKTAGAVHSALALHTTHKLAYGLAIRVVFQGTMEPFTLTLGTLRTERTFELGHACCTDSYISPFDAHVRPVPYTHLWEVATRLVAGLRSPAGIPRGGRAGMLAYMLQSNPTRPARNTRAPTGRECTLLARAEGAAPCAQALSLSNLERAALPVGAVDGAQGQSASLFGPLLGAYALGHVVGFRVTTFWRKGAAVRREEVKEVKRLGDEWRRRLTFGELVSNRM
jgi:hypothetical protein